MERSSSSGTSRRSLNSAQTFREPGSPPRTTSLWAERRLEHMRVMSRLHTLAPPPPLDPNLLYWRRRRGSRSRVDERVVRPPLLPGATVPGPAMMSSPEGRPDEKVCAFPPSCTPFPTGTLRERRGIPPERRSCVFTGVALTGEFSQPIVAPAPSTLMIIIFYSPGDHPLRRPLPPQNSLSLSEGRRARNQVPSCVGSPELSVCPHKGLAQPEAFIPKF